MIKKILSVLSTALVAATMMCGCAEVTKELPTGTEQPVAVESPTEEIALDGSEKYIVDFEIKQSHFSLNLRDHLKDKMNTFTIEIPVDKDYYNSISEGQTISDNFRMGSLIMHGSFGKWEVLIKSKKIVSLNK